MEKAIAKMEDGKVILFFPEYSVNPGMIQHWDGCHGEASLLYFRSLKPARDATAIAAAVKLYLQHYKTDLVLVKRDSSKMRTEREISRNA